MSLVTNNDIHFMATLYLYTFLAILEALEEIGKDVGEVHYLPHTPVIREEKQTTKIRAVFDASSYKVNGPSLNKCL